MSHPSPALAAPDAAPADPSPAARRAAARALIDGELEVLTELTGIGMEIARAAGRAAVAGLDGAPGAGADPGLTYTRAARTVRMCIALQSRLLNDLEALDRGETE